MTWCEANQFDETSYIEIEPLKGDSFTRQKKSYTTAYTTWNLLEVSTKYLLKVYIYMYIYADSIVLWYIYIYLILFTIYTYIGSTNSNYPDVA